MSTYTKNINEIVKIIHAEIADDKKSLYYDGHVYVRNNRLRNLLAEIIVDWAAERGTKVSVRIEGYEIYTPDYTNRFGRTERIGFYVSSVGIFNNVGGLEKKSLWLNKIMIAYQGGGEYAVRSHRARTDPQFLSPLDTDFLKFFTKLTDDINSKIQY